MILILQQINEINQLKHKFEIEKNQVIGGNKYGKLINCLILFNFILIIHF